MTKRSSAWLIFFALAVAAVAATTSLTLEGLNADRFDVRMFLVGLILSAVFTGLTLDQFQRDELRRLRRAEQADARRRHMTQARARELAAVERQARLAAERERQRADEPTFRLPSWAVYGYRSDAMRRSFEDDWRSQTGEIRI